MKKAFLAALLLLQWVICPAQANLDAIFNKAISDGPDSDGLYHMVNSKDKNISLDSAEQFIADKGYYVIKGKKRDIQRFGDITSIFDSVSFLNWNDYAPYAFSALRTNTTLSLKDLKNTGSFYLAEDDGVYRRVNSLISFYVGKIKRLKPYRDAFWSGNVKNTMLDGNGVGFIDAGKGVYMFFSGTFKNGIPVSDIYLRSVTKKDMSYPAIKKNEISSGTYPQTDIIIAAQNVDTDDSHLYFGVKMFINEHYSEFANRLDVAYNNAKNLRIDNYGDFVKDGFVDIFIHTFEKVKNDKDNLLPKAYEISALYQVVDALRMNIEKSYWGVSLFSLNWVWYDELEKGDRECLTTGIAEAAEYKTKSQYGFGSFFSSALSLLNEKKQTFEKDIIAQNNRFWEAHNSLAEEHQAAQQEYQEYLAQHGHEIDWDKCESPSGDLLKKGLLLVSGYQYEYDGCIVFKNGHTYKYNISYWTDRSFDCYELNDLPYGSFESMEKMLDALIDWEAKR